MDLFYLYVFLNCCVVEIFFLSLRGCDINVYIYICNKIEFCIIWCKIFR